MLPVLAVVTALVIGALAIIFSDSIVLSSWAGFFRHPLDTLQLSWQTVYDSYRALFQGAFGSAGALSETVVNATPLILVGLSIAVGFRAGLFNIGGEGQLTVGAISATVVGFEFTSLPAPVHVVLVVLAGFAGGAIWGAIPGFLKAKSGAHEVITTIMLNYVSYRLADYALSTTFYRRPDRTDPISKPATVAYPHLFGSAYRISLGIIVAIIVAALVAFLINRTTVGFEFQAVGANPDASRAAGMSPTRTFIVVMALAGGLAGLAGANQLLTVSPSLTPGYSSGFGFDGIAIALLGKSRPSGVILAAFLFGAMRAGSRAMQAATQTPVDIVLVIQAFVILFIAAPPLVRSIWRVRLGEPVTAEILTRGWGG